MLSVIGNRIWNAWSKDRGLSLDQVINHLEGVVASEDQFTLVAHDGETFIGTISLIKSDLAERPNITPWIADLWIEQGFRKHRLGTTLIKAAEQLAYERGEATLHLNCTPALRQFYNALGWTEIEQNIGLKQVSIFRKNTGYARDSF